jgi:hypothetical protein
MPRPQIQPSYRFHKARNCDIVTIDGRNHYLETYDSPESHEAYARLIADACVRLEQLTGLWRGQTQVPRFLKELGLNWQRLRAIPMPPKKPGGARRRAGRVLRHPTEAATGRGRSRGRKKG